MYVARTLESFVSKAAEQFPVVLLTGARQVGKTTLLRHLSQENRTYVTLDDPLVLSLAKTEPALFLQRFPPPVLIDEVQYAVELLPHIKMAVDRAQRPGQFWLTGSQQFHLMKGVSESLAGRVAVVHLLGLSRRELVGRGQEARPFLPTPENIQYQQSTGGKLTLKELYRLIWRGAFPAIALNDVVDRDLFYSSFVQTYLQRDVRDLARVGDVMAFLRFLRAAAADRPALEPRRSGARCGRRPQYGKELALHFASSRDRLSTGAVLHQPEQAPCQGAQAVLSRHRPGRLSDGMGKSGNP